MRTMMLLCCVAAVMFTAGCVLGLSPEQAAEVREFESSMAEERVKLKALQTQIEELTAEISALPTGSAKAKELWAKRDELVVLAAEVKGRIAAFAEAVKKLKAKGVPWWSVALNAGEQLLLLLFGGGGLLAGIIGKIRNTKLRSVAKAVISGVEKSTKSGGSVRKAIATSASNGGVSADLDKLVNPPK